MFFIIFKKMVFKNQSSQLFFIRFIYSSWNFLKVSSPLSAIIFQLMRVIELTPDMSIASSSDFPSFKAFKKSFIIPSTNDSKLPSFNESLPKSSSIALLSSASRQDSLSTYQCS